MGRSKRLESGLQDSIKEEIQTLYPDCEIRKFEVRQGDPDLVIFHKNKWAMLEVKKSKDSPHQPNQDYYVDKFNRMSFARFIYPENRKEVIHDLQQTFESIE